MSQQLKIEVPPDVAPSALREALGRSPTGVAVATTLDDLGRPVGLTINSYNSVSLEPALILWSLALSSPNVNAFRDYGAFAVNILHTEQSNLCKQFSRWAPDKFDNVDGSRGYRDLPVLDGAMVPFECATYQIVEGGDHEVYMGAVKRIHKTDSSPLVFHRGRFVELADCEVSP